MNIKVINGNFSGVYSITNKKTGKKYIGQTRLSINERLSQHTNAVDAKNGIDYAIQKYGVDAFEYAVETPMWMPTVDQLWFEEQRLIDKYNTYDPNGYNLTRGNHKKVFADYIAEYNKDFKSVSVNIFNDIKRVYSINNIENKEVLLINRFDEKIVDYLVSFHQCKVANIYKPIDDKDELASYINEELDNMDIKDFDIIISNPPYGRIGAEITDKVNKLRKNDSVFINLMPMNDYLRVDGLCKYVDMSSKVTVDFGDSDVAQVTSHIVKMNKQPAEYITKDAFEIETYNYNGADIFKKYLYETRKREHYAIDNAQCRPGIEVIKSTDFNTTTSFIIHFRTINHFRKSDGWGKENSTEYRWNINKELDKQYILDNYCNNNDRSTFGFIKFNTNTERDNFTDFMYNTGYKFFRKVAKIANPDSSIIYGKIMPKVDWSKSWTVEELLVDYGYNQDEVAEIMELINED